MNKPGTAPGECRLPGGSGVGVRFGYRRATAGTSAVGVVRFAGRTPRLGDLRPLLFVLLYLLLRPGVGERLEFELDPDCDELNKECRIIVSRATI